MSELERPRPAEVTFLEAKTHLRLAEIACRDAWLAARSGEPVAWRRYRAALRRQERAVEALRHMDIVPRDVLARTSRRLSERRTNA